MLGNRFEANNEEHQAPLANNYDMLNCAVDLLGLSNLDLPNVIAVLQEGSNFPSLADRLQQGFLGFLFLAEALRHPQGFRQDAAFQVNGQPVYDNSEVFYDSNSQSAILGTGLLAVAQNVTTGVLGVPGMNYMAAPARMISGAIPGRPCRLSPIPRRAWVTTRTFDREPSRLRGNRNPHLCDRSHG